MEIKDLLFINYHDYENKEGINEKIYLLTKDVLIEYFNIIKQINTINENNQEVKALKKINNHLFNLMYELLVNARMELFNSCFRLARSIIEDKILLEFIYKTSNKQAYWYNKWDIVQESNESDVDTTSKEYEYALYIKNSFIATHEKIYSYDYGFAQETLGNQYLTMKEIMNYVDPTTTSYSYYKLYSDLSHGSNKRSNLFSYLLSHDKEFNQNCEIGIYTVIKESFDIIIETLSVFNISPDYIDAFKEKQKVLEDYYVENNIVTSTSFKNFIVNLKVPKVV